MFLSFIGLYYFIYYLCNVLLYFVCGQHWPPLRVLPVYFNNNNLPTFPSANMPRGSQGS